MGHDPAGHDRAAQTGDPVGQQHLLHPTVVSKHSAGSRSVDARVWSREIRTNRIRDHTSTAQNTCQPAQLP